MKRIAAAIAIIASATTAPAQDPLDTIPSGTGATVVMINHAAIERDGAGEALWQHIVPAIEGGPELLAAAAELELDPRHVIRTAVFAAASDPEGETILTLAVTTSRFELLRQLENRADLEAVEYPEGALWRQFDGDSVVTVTPDGLVILADSSAPARAARALDPARAWAANEGRLLPPSAAAAYAWLWIDHPAAGTSTFAAVCESLAVDRAAFTLSPAAQGNLRFEARLFIDAAAEVEESTTGARDFLAALANQDREPVVRLLAEQTTVESNEESHMVTLRTDLSRAQALALQTGIKSTLLSPEE